MDETKTIKLSDEQILEKEIQKEKMEMQLEIAEVNQKHFERMLENNYPMRQAKAEYNNLLKSMEMLKHNIKALGIQIESGEM